MIFEKLAAVQREAGGERHDFKASVVDGVMRIAVERPANRFALLVAAYMHFDAGDDLDGEFISGGIKPVVSGPPC